MKAKTGTSTENGFKETEIGLIPKDWDIDKLGKYCEVFSGYAFKSSDFAEKGVLIVKIGNLQDGTIVVDNRTNYYPKGIDECLEKFVLKREDVLIALTGATTGKVAVVPEKFEGSLLNQRVGKFNIFDKKLDNSFFRFFSITSGFQDDIKGNILKSAQGNVSPKKIEQLTIILPPFSEQQKIAFVLSKIQQAIEQQNKIIHITKELKKSLMNKLFTEGLHGEEQEETEIGLIPKSWEVKIIDNIVEKTKQIDPRRKGNFTFKYIDVSGISNEYFRIAEHKIYNNSNAPSRARKLVQADDVIFATVRPTLKRIAYINEVYDDEICSTAFCVLRSKTDTLLSKYLYYYLQMDEFIEELAKLQRGVSYPAVTDADIKRQKIPLPDYDEQNEIANILSNIDKKLSQAEARKQALQALFKTILNQLMTGRVRVKNVDIEVN